MEMPLAQGAPGILPAMNAPGSKKALVHGSHGKRRICTDLKKSAQIRSIR
jgi:hypothetical protein